MAALGCATRWKNVVANQQEGSGAILSRGHGRCECFLPLAAIGRAERNTCESAEGWSDISGGRVRCKPPLPDTSAVEDDRYSLIVRIERAMGGRARRENPILTRHDDQVAASAWIVIQCRGAFDGIRRRPCASLHH